ncbi:MAG TPA: hypothetical protein VFF32_03395 [Dermatophilaceae bacterium]|nr:hypothetical protein [Dermatophilaceae bacterium]
MKLRACVLAVALVGATLLVAPVAGASAADVNKINFDEAGAPGYAATYTEECGFPVSATESGHLIFVTVDGQQKVSIYDNVTLTAKGVSLYYASRGHAFEYADGFRVTGIIYSVQTADGVTLVKDRGFLQATFTEEDLTLILHGKQRLPVEGFDICPYFG